MKYYIGSDAFNWINVVLFYAFRSVLYGQRHTDTTKKTRVFFVVFVLFPSYTEGTRHFMCFILCVFFVLCKKNRKTTILEKKKKSRIFDVARHVVFRIRWFLRHCDVPSASNINIIFKN